MSGIEIAGLTSQWVGLECLPPPLPQSEPVARSVFRSSLLMLGDLLFCTGLGKSTLAKDMLLNWQEMFGEEPRHVVIVYNYYQPMYSEIQSKYPTIACSLPV